MKTPPHIRALNRLADLFRRYEALPYDLVESQGDAFVEWDENMDNLYHTIQDTETVTAGQLENIKMSETAMNHWELVAGMEPGARAGEQIEMRWNVEE